MEEQDKDITIAIDIIVDELSQVWETIARNFHCEESTIQSVNDLCPDNLKKKCLTYLNDIWWEEEGSNASVEKLCSVLRTMKKNRTREKIEREVQNRKLAEKRKLDNFSDHDQCIEKKTCNVEKNTCVVGPLQDQENINVTDDKMEFEIQSTIKNTPPNFETQTLQENDIRDVANLESDTQREVKDCSSDDEVMETQVSNVMSEPDPHTEITHLVSPLVESTLQLQDLRSKYGNNGIHQDLALALRHMGSLHHNQQSYEKAEKYKKESADMYQALYGKDSRDENHALALLSLGVTYGMMGQHEQALNVKEQSWAIFQRIHANMPNHSYAVAHAQLGVTYHALELYEKSLSEKRAAVSMFQRLYGVDGVDVDFAVALNQLGVTCHKAGQDDLSIEMKKASVEMFRKIFDTSENKYMAMVINSLAVGLEKQDKRQDAIGYYVEASAMMSTIYDIEKKQGKVGSREYAQNYIKDCIRNYRKLEEYGKEEGYTGLLKEFT